ncbi:rhizopuspepsinogen precursor [Jimgerdemannia flammicorona]|uniref:rhizopuspepsin n=1 Tax=Jimgerdemannia flammicorona TaxID=994334 RepID=A0A433QA40_9FUNG|nr:rhizopuspepsinogen precursor [Jimgerdemannia flammicorona]
MKTNACIIAILMVASSLIQATPLSEAQVQEKGWTIPMENNPHFRRNATMQSLRAWRKFNKLASGHRIGRVNVALTLPFIDEGHDYEYYASVQVGTPPRTFKLDFDTGSADLWFPYNMCKVCKGKTIYNPQKSSSYKKDGRPWSIRYGDGSTSAGILGIDTVYLGALKIMKQTIDMANVISNGFQGDVIDGLLGLAFNSITTVKGINTPFDNLISQKLIDRPVFGVYLGKFADGGGGAYTFGGYDKSKIGGNLTTVPVDKSQGFWGITVDSLSVGNKSVAKSFQGIIDTGTTLVLLPNDMAAAVAKRYGATDNYDGSYTISCDSSKLPNLKFSIGGASFKVPGPDLVFEKNPDDTCTAGFGYSSLNFAILGDVFIKNNYVVFNQQVPQVQIAPLAGL